jgi:hypothetical protein
MQQDMKCRVSSRLLNLSSRANYGDEVICQPPQAAAELSRLAEQFDSDNLLRLIESCTQGGD